MRGQANLYNIRANFIRQGDHMTREKWEETFQSLIEYIRENHALEIDDAYEYFWEEEDPEEFIGGTALVMGFHNFEDWMACDYMDKKTGKSFIDLYLEAKSPSEEQRAVLEAMRQSYISVFEVRTAGDTVTLEDLSNGTELSLSDDRLKCLSQGDMFGARIFDAGGGLVMTNAIYPFGNRFREAVMEHLEAMYRRYAKHYEEPSMEKFLRQETYTINTVWVTCLFRAR